MTGFDQSQKEFWSENTNLRAYDHPVVEAFAHQRVVFIQGLLRFTPWYLISQFQRAGLKEFMTMTVGTFTPNRIPIWLYKILSRLLYRMPLIGISNMALASVA